MIITFEDAVNNLRSYNANKFVEEDITIEVDGDLKAPSAIASVEMLSAKRPSITQKVNFIYGLLLGTSVSIKLKDKLLASFNVNENMSLEAIDVFRSTPGVFYYFIEAIYGVFLKNCYPQLNDSLQSQKVE